MRVGLRAGIAAVIILAGTIGAPSPSAASEDGEAAPQRHLSNPPLPPAPADTPPGPALGAAAAPSWIDTSDRSAVLEAYHAEFDRKEPASGWTGNVGACNAGTTGAPFRQSVIQRVNWYRSMAGTGAEVVEDAALSGMAQQAALISAANEDLDHEPPADWSCYSEAGEEAAGRSNLALGWYGIDAIDAYIDDYFIQNVGHRGWILHPAQVRMGTGDIPPAGPHWEANALHVIDPEVDYFAHDAPVRDVDRFYSWPPPGYVPAATVPEYWSLHVDDPEVDLSYASAEIRFGGEQTSNSAHVTHKSEDRIVFIVQVPPSGADTTVDVQIGFIRRGSEYVEHSWTTTVIPEAVGSHYVPIQPCRVLDTRSGGGGVFGPNVQRSYKVRGGGSVFASQGGKAGGCGVPDGATAVEATITAVNPSGNGYTRAWPAGTGMPNATFLNYTRSQGVTNTGAVRLSDGGSRDLALRNFGGPTHYVVDVQGYYQVESGLRYVPTRPCRVVDTRRAGGAFKPGERRAYQVAGAGSRFSSQGGSGGGCQVPDGATTAEVSVTAVDPGGVAGYLRVWGGTGSPPNATFLNYTRARGVTNTGAVPLAAGLDDISVQVYAAATHVVVDVQGYFVADTGSLYVPISPCRLADSRAWIYRTWVPEPKPFAPGDNDWIRATGDWWNGITFPFYEQGGAVEGCGIPSSAIALEASLSAVVPSGGGFARLWSANRAEETATFLNYAAGQSITNTGAVEMGLPGVINLQLKNYGGTAHFVLDVQGYFLE